MGESAKTDQGRYEAAWAELRRYQRTCTWGLLPVLALFAAAMAWPTFQTVAIIVATPMFCSVTAASFFRFAVACPRCGKAFMGSYFRLASTEMAPPKFGLPDRCRNCGLPYGAPGDPGPDGE